MSTSLRRRSATFAGLVLLSLIVLAASVQTSEAMVSLGTGATGSEAVLTAPAQAQASAAVLRHGQLDRVHAAVVPVGTVESAATGISATAAWLIVAAVALAAAAIGVWELVRRRRSSAASASGDAFCTLHPEAAGCRAA